MNLEARELAKRNVEVWKDVFDFPKYEVSNLGNVRRKGKSKPLFIKEIKEKSYHCVSLYKEDWKITYRLQTHAIMLSTFDGPKLPNQVCRHLDGNSHNNRLDNICWGTYKENHDDAIKHGTHSKPPIHVQIGEKNHAVKLKEEDVLYIRASSESAKQLAKQFNISHWTIFDIRAGASWKHLLPQNKGESIHD